MHNFKDSKKLAIGVIKKKEKPKYRKDFNAIRISVVYTWAHMSISFYFNSLIIMYAYMRGLRILEGTSLLTAYSTCSGSVHYFVHSLSVCAISKTLWAKKNSKILQSNL